MELQEESCNPTSLQHTTHTSETFRQVQVGLAKMGKAFSKRGIWVKVLGESYPENLKSVGL